MKFTVLVNGREVEIEDALAGADAIEVAPGFYSILRNGRSFDVRVRGGRVIVDGVSHEVEITDPRELRDPGSSGGAHGRAEIVSPMPGKVIRILVAEGQAVEAGQGILVVEAMKMQNELASPRKGIVTSIRTTAGAAVGGGEVLAVVE
jgi:biotin carboxyl carrier protein